MAAAVGRALALRRTAHRGGGHRDRQNLRLSGAGAALGSQRDHLDGDPHAPGPTLSARSAVAGTRLGAAGEGGAAQGPGQLSLPPSTGTHPAADVVAPRGARLGAPAFNGVALGGDHPIGRSVGAHRPARTIRRLAHDHLDARELPRAGVSAILPLPRRGGPARRAAPPTSWSSIITCCSPISRSRMRGSAICCPAPRP